MKTTMVEKRTITFKKEEIIEALQDYYNSKEENGPVTFYPTNITVHNPDSSKVEIELEINEYEE